MAILIALLSFILIAYIIYDGSKDPVVELTDDYIKIKGGVFYSVKYEFKDVVIVDTVSVLPEIRWRTNGFALMNILRGHFRTKENEKIILFVDTKSKPFIYLELNSGQKLFLNFKNPDNTIDCYSAIKNKI